MERELGDRRTHTWWDARLLGAWVAVNAGAYVVVVVGGVALEELFAGTTRQLSTDHWALAVLGVTLIGASFHGFVVGRLQWSILRRRLPALRRRRWVVATFIPAFFVWLVVLAPQAVDTVAKGSPTITAFRDAFVQALVLGPLIGLAQAAALRGHSQRWAWWFVANVTTYLFGAVTFRVGAVMLEGLRISVPVSSAFPLLTFVFHGLWMLWVTDPAVVPGTCGRDEASRAEDLGP